jgi:histidine triad (HIT) family protein
MDCVFCKIADGSIPADLVYSDDGFLAFRDIHPMAPVHDILIPKKHIPSVNGLSSSGQALAGKMLLIAKQVAEKEGISESGYRLAINCGRNGTQAVPHLHVHILGGRLLSAELG